MKKFLPFLSIAFLLAACSSNPETETKTLQSANQSAAAADTAGLAQFQAWKAQNELTVANLPQQQENQPAVQEPVKTVTVIRERIIEKPAPVKKSPAVKKPSAPATPSYPTTDESTSNTGTASNDNTIGSGTGTGTAESPIPQETAKKEGWSKAAKGAAIGGAGGAVIGAIISKKNPAVGAAIGGVLGGAVGYGVGRSKDKKDGRY